MTSILLAAALSVQIDLGSLIRGGSKAPVAPPRATCNIKTVSYRFVGTPGTTFRYDGDAYKVPASGSIELIANQRATEYEIESRRLPLNVFPADQFGSRTVTLPSGL